NIQHMIQSRKEALPGQYTTLKEAVGATLSEVRGIVHEADVPVGEKAVKVRDVVVARVHPVLQQVIEEGKKLIGRAKVKGEESKETTQTEVKEKENEAAKENGVTDGSA
ncbi:hypothetical protein FRC11_012704, partial [Ceratobasidium sp. 423]